MTGYPDRFRSFAERYIIERASTFKAGEELECAWKAILQAKTVYKAIAQVAKAAEPPDDDFLTQAKAAGIGVSPHPLAGAASSSMTTVKPPASVAAAAASIKSSAARGWHTGVKRLNPQGYRWGKP